MTSFLHALAAALEPFHRLDPAGWFAWRSLLSPTAALVLVVAGLFCLAVGAHEKLFRFVACPLGILLGIALTPAVVGLLQSTRFPTRPVELALPVVLGLLAAIVPQTIAFVALGSIGALVGASVVADHELLVGALPGFFIAGVVGVVFSRFVDTFSAAAFGAILLVGGALGAWGHGPLKLLGGSVWVPPVAAALLTAMGASLQLVAFANPDGRAAKRAEAQDAKQRAREDKERAKRFASYGKSGGR